MYQDASTQNTVTESTRLVAYGSEFTVEAPARQDATTLCIKRMAELGMFERQAEEAPDRQKHKHRRLAD